MSVPAGEFDVRRFDIKVTPGEPDYPPTFDELELEAELDWSPALGSVVKQRTKTSLPVRSICEQSPERPDCKNEASVIEVIIELLRPE